MRSLRSRRSGRLRPQSLRLFAVPVPAAIAGALLASCAHPPPADTFGWSVRLSELCGKPYTTFVDEAGAEHNCEMVEGQWVISEAVAAAVERVNGPEGDEP
jgi:hypothetical protein